MSEKFNYEILKEGQTMGYPSKRMSLIAHSVKKWDYTDVTYLLECDYKIWCECKSYKRALDLYELVRNCYGLLGVWAAEPNEEGLNHD